MKYVDEIEDLQHKKSIEKNKFLTKKESEDKNNVNEIENNVNNHLPVIHIITPTYTRPLQRAELTRTRNTISAIPNGNVHWIVIEDRSNISAVVQDIVNNADVSYRTHVSETTKTTCEKTKCHRGLNQRNRALEIVRKFNAKHGIDNINGVVYFADDDNAYDVRLFETMRTIPYGKVGMWPVGFVGGLKFEGPRCSKSGKFKKWHSAYKIKEREYPVDMAAFAFHASFVSKLDVRLEFHDTEKGFLESDFLKQMINDKKELYLPHSCEKIWAWHTQAKPVNLKAEERKPSDSFVSV